MILLNERVNHLISCLHHKGEIAVRFSGLNGTSAMSVIVMIEASKTSTIEHLVYSDFKCLSQFSPTMISS